jgi:antitoxin component HigA of HigAB toxin-antitoxin module
LQFNYSEEPFKAWHDEAAQSIWRFPQDIKDCSATPIEAIKFRMELGGLSVKDLEPMIGRSNRVYEILNGKRSLTLPMNFSGQSALQRQHLPHLILARERNLDEHGFALGI